MSEKNLITKARLEQIKQAEGDLVDNLYQHANASLSKTHGFQFIDLPYTDSHGDRVGNYSMRITTSDHVNYYAPLELTLLAGKDHLTGISAETNVVSTVIPGGAAWVTDFTQEDEQDLLVTKESVLLPHTRLSHWETHTGGIYQVIPQIILDSAGHRVSNYVARILVDGVELWIPCDLRPGGPLQPPRVAFPAITTAVGTNYNFCSMGRDNHQFGHFYWAEATGGTEPIEFEFEYNNYQPTSNGWGNITSDPLLGSGDWLPMPYSTEQWPAEDNMPGNPVDASYAYGPGNQMTIRSDAGGGNECAATIRGKYTGAGGTSYTNYCVFVASDEDGCGPISDPDVNQSAKHRTIANDPVWIDGFYV